MFLAIIFCSKNEINSLDSVIYELCTVIFDRCNYVRSYTITEGACPRSVTHLAKNRPYIPICIGG